MSTKFSLRHLKSLEPLGEYTKRDLIGTTVRLLSRRIFPPLLHTGLARRTEMAYLYQRPATANARTAPHWASRTRRNIPDSDLFHH